MKRLDRYVLSETLLPFLFGIGAFLAVLVGVELLYDMLRLVYQEGVPAGAALQIFLLALPGVVTLTFPMAIMFGSLMAMGRLSGDGELVAMRAGGVSLPRLGLSVIVFGFVVACIGFVVSETVVPWASHRSWEIKRDLFSTVAGERDLAIEIRDDGKRLQRWLYAEEFDTEEMTLRYPTVLDFTFGSRPHLLTAESGQWQGERWILRNVEYSIMMGDRSQLQSHHDELEWEVGRTAKDVEGIRKMPEDMSLAELQEQEIIARTQGREEWANRIRQHFHVRLALPWATVGLAMLGIGLGVQRQRSSRGIGMGVSLLVIFVYYVVLHTLTIMGERGVAHPALVAWLPNVLLYTAGLGFLLRSSR